MEGEVRSIRALALASTGALEEAESEIRANLDKAVELGKVAPKDADAAFGRLEYAGSVDEAARQADLVIEAVPEKMEIKKFDPVARKHVMYKEHKIK